MKDTFSEMISCTNYLAKDFISYSYPQFNLDIPLIIFVENHKQLEQVFLRLKKLFALNHSVQVVSCTEDKVLELSKLCDIKITETVKLVLQPAKIKKRFTFNDLLEIMYRLRRKSDGCPWDIAQTHESIKLNAIEEAYELVDAINNKNYVDICEESGDVLLQTVFHSKIAEDNNKFDIHDVISILCDKIITRHTHVFGEDKAQNSDDALNLWTKNKMTEKKQSTFTETLIAVPKAFPAILRAEKVQKRAAKSGFDFENLQQIIDKIIEETNEIKDAISADNKVSIREEIGDLLFSVVNLLRYFGVDGEETLNFSTQKFIERFKAMEDLAIENGLELDKLTSLELDEIYNKAKDSLKNKK